MAMTKEQQQALTAASPLLVVVALVGWYMYWFSPLQARLASKAADLDQTLRQVETLKASASRLDALQKECDDLRAQVKLMERRLPRTKNLEDILRTVTETAIKNRVTISSLSPGGESSQAYYIEVPFSLNLTAGLHNLGKFLAALGQQERIFTAKNLSLSYSPNPKKGYTVQGSFTLSAYVYTR
jgi:Tfp pilus assembly protein PilO